MRPRITSFSSSTSSEYSEQLSSTVSQDEDVVNLRIKPCWENYAALFRKRGFRLETSQDAKRYYESIFHGPVPDSPSYICYKMEYTKACSSRPDALCKDAGLVSSLRHGLVLTSLTLSFISTASYRALNLARYAVPRHSDAGWKTHRCQGRMSPESPVRGRSHFNEPTSAQ